MGAGDGLFEWKDGVTYFRGLRVGHETVDVAGRAFKIACVHDAADLLDQPDYAKRFLEEDLAPYGLELWPAALMLAEHILRDPPGAGRAAIELGCGLALVSIAAASHGWRVIATDNDPTSLRFARFNASINAVRIDGYEELDWAHPPQDGRFERVFAADVLYQATDHAWVLKSVDALLASEGVALVADPNRGVADGFASMAETGGFRVEILDATAVVASNKRVDGRIFVLRRA